MVSLNPSFINVTYGAGGGTKETTLELVKRASTSSIVVPHINCDQLTNELLDTYLQELEEVKVENIVALRGDRFDSTEFGGSLDLIRAIKKRSNLCVGAACYPEGHPDSEGLVSDVEFLRRKISEGCEYLVTQMCFSSSKLSEYVETLYEMGIDVPIIVGIMPIVKKQSLLKVRDSIGINIPKDLEEIVDKYESDEESLVKAGIDYCIKEIQELRSLGVNNIHIYTMNNYEVTSEIMRNIT